MLLQHACASEAEYAAFDGSATTFPFVAKESPLLPNLGVANILGYFTDITVRILPLALGIRISLMHDMMTVIY